MNILKEAIVQNKISILLSVMGIVAATAAMLSFQAPSQISAQVIPSVTSEPPNTGIEFIGQNSTDLGQNITNANITQLATVLPFSSEPITPAAYTSDSDDSSSSSSSSSDDDHDDGKDDHDDDNNDNHDNNDDHDHHDHGGGGGSVAVAGGGAAVAVAR